MAEHDFTIRLYLKHDKARQDGAVPIYAKLKLDGQKTETATKKYIDPRFWDSTSQSAINHENADELNKVLSAFRSKLDKAFLQLCVSGEDFTVEEVKLLSQGEFVKKQKGIVEVMEEHNKHFLSLIPAKYSQGSYKNYKSTLKYLKEFVPAQYKKQDVPLTQVNYAFLEAYYSFLLAKKNCKNNGANKQIQRVKKVMNYALKHEYIATNPTATFSLTSDPVTKVILTNAEIDRLANLALHNQTMEKVRDVFLFQCYTGLAYADAYALAPEHFTVGDDGEKWIKKDRTKSKIAFMVPLLPPALLILQKYLRAKQGDERILPVLSNQKMNQNLKLIQELAGIRKNLTTHLARHTFSTTICLANGVPIETVSKMLGHTKLATTQIYAKVLEGKIAEDMNALKQRLGNSKGG